MARLIDCDGDHWEPVEGGYQCVEFPDNFFPDYNTLDMIWGPLWPEDD